MLFAAISALWWHYHNQRAIAADGEIIDQNVANPMNVVWDLDQDNGEVNAFDDVDALWQPLFDPPPALDLDPNAPDD